MSQLRPAPVPSSFIRVREHSVANPDIREVRCQKRTKAIIWISPGEHGVGVLRRVAPLPDQVHPDLVLEVQRLHTGHKTPTGRWEDIRMRMTFLTRFDSPEASIGKVSGSESLVQSIFALVDRVKETRLNEKVFFHNCPQS